MNINFRIIEAANGQQAIELATREKPILIEQLQSLIAAYLETSSFKT